MIWHYLAQQMNQAEHGLEWSTVTWGKGTAKPCKLLSMIAYSVHVTACQGD